MFIHPEVKKDVLKEFTRLQDKFPLAESADLFMLAVNQVKEWQKFKTDIFKYEYLTDDITWL